ncbi:palmitoyl-protein thioesterase [Clonorchis sinensis]|uniref:Palmitoyl-protein thioesterase n=1 Tax=Clonorchis sinensis TaxID=79923 RepID=G7YKR2_CLOSI|nr:palmitoyl-protein thioesterase [Clonorchis sinensis]
MCTRSGLLLIILLVVDVATSSKTLPVIIWHGMGNLIPKNIYFLSTGDHAKGGGIRQLGELVQQMIPGTKVKCIATSQSDAEVFLLCTLGLFAISKDIEDSYFKPIDIQITQVCNELLSDPVFRDGVHMIGLSQGGLFVRALAQRCPFKTVGAVVSIGGPQMGVFGVPKCRDIGPIHWCFVMDKLLSYGAYSNLVQQHLVQAQYWHDPLREETYREKCQFLPDINQERVSVNITWFAEIPQLFNSTYRDNLLKVKHLVLVRFADDTVLKPKESELQPLYDKYTVLTADDDDDDDLQLGNQTSGILKNMYSY